MTIELEKEIAYILKQVGVQQNLSGYRYIKHAVGLIIEDEDILNHITKKLYPAIAEKFNTKPACVERCIRHAIDIMYLSMNEDMHRYIFGNSISLNKNKPASSHFLAALAEAVRFIHVSSAHSDISSTISEETAIEHMFSEQKDKEGNHVK